jgi:thiol-disulfide isomerase/thioredoxin
VIHDQDIVSDESRLTADLGVLPWLSVGAVLPLRVFRTRIHYLQDGMPVAIENPFIHHHDETLVGPGDPWVLARAASTLSGVTVGARGGLSLPLGRTEEDPFILGDMGLPHEHSQFGTGTVMPVLGLDAALSVGSARVDAFALTIQSLYTNGHGYKAGDRYAGGAGVASDLGTKRWRFRATLEAQHETAEMWHGIVRTDEGNTGRTDLLAGAEVTRRLADTWHVGIALKVPVYEHVSGGQLDIPLFAGVTVGTSLHVFGHHDEPPPAVEPGNWSGLDELDASTDGAAVPLVPVPGKITVYDFWAPWCGPCHVVDHELAEVARRHPRDIAVRKINIVDTDSPAAQKYLGDGTLPHLKVFGRDGTLLWERSGAPLVLTSEVEKLVTGATKRAVVPGARRIEIEVLDSGYVPARIEIRHGEPVTLVFTRKSDATCATDVHFALPDGSRVDEDLPLGTPVEIPVLVAAPGEVVYSCGMNMDHGTIVVK